MPRVKLRVPENVDAPLGVLAGNRFIERLSKSRQGRMASASAHRGIILRYLCPDQKKLEADYQRFLAIAQQQEQHRHQRLVGKIQTSVNERLRQLAN